MLPSLLAVQINRSAWNSNWIEMAARVENMSGKMKTSIILSILHSRPFGFFKALHASAQILLNWSSVRPDVVTNAAWSDLESKSILDAAELFIYRGRCLRFFIDWCRFSRGVPSLSTIHWLIFISLPPFMIFRLMSNVHPIYHNTFAVVTMIRTPLQCFPIAFDHIVCSIVINLFQMPKLKGVCFVSTNRCCFIFLEVGALLV